MSSKVEILRNIIKENLRNWFKKEKWKRIDTQGNIKGDCGTMPKGKKTQRCLPAAKARSLTKKQRAATSRKKTRSNKQFVSNTKKAKVKLKEMDELKLQELKNLFEKLCAKGKAYAARRKAAGEKHGAYLMGRAVKVCKGQMNETYLEIDALHENEEYCPKCTSKIQEAIKHEIKKVAKEAKTKPAKGKRFAKKVKNPKTGRTRTVSYGQAGKAKKGGDRIRPGTAKGNAYCARSAKIKKCKNPPCANTLSRRKWKCQGSRSVK